MTREGPEVHAATWMSPQRTVGGDPARKAMRFLQRTFLKIRNRNGGGWRLPVAKDKGQVRTKGGTGPCGQVRCVPPASWVNSQRKLLRAPAPASTRPVGGDRIGRCVFGGTGGPCPQWSSLRNALPAPSPSLGVLSPAPESHF